MTSISSGLFDYVPLHIAQRSTITQIHPCARVASPDPNWGSLCLAGGNRNRTGAVGGEMSRYHLPNLADDMYLFRNGCISYVYTKHRDGVIVDTRESQKQRGGISVGTTVQKWGNSLAIRIPRTVAEAAAIDQGTELEWRVMEHSIILTAKKKAPCLEELLSKITPENRHSEIDWGVEGNKLL